MVTGSGAIGGLGHVIAGVLLEAGAHVIITGRNAEAGARALSALPQGGEAATFIHADLAGVDGVRNLAERAGDVDILINNASIVLFAATVDQSEEGFDAAFAANVRAPFFLTAALVPGMRRRGGGSIVMVSSTAARVGINGLAVYGATKGAVEALTRAWASEFAVDGIRVNAVLPGPMLTAKTVASMGTDVGGMAQTTALRRVGEPIEVARAAAFLAGDAASYITGAVLAADGGRTAI
nr:SDR family oxidoreductase [Streptomyces sp. SID8381]